MLRHEHQVLYYQIVEHYKKSLSHLIMSHEKNIAFQLFSFSVSFFFIFIDWMYLNALAFLFIHSIDTILIGYNRVINEIRETNYTHF